MRSYLFGLTTLVLNEINIRIPGFETYSSQPRSVPAQRSVTLLPTNTATFSGPSVNCPQTTATNHNEYLIVCHHLNIRFVTLSAATHMLDRAGSGLNYEDND